MSRYREHDKRMLSMMTRNLVVILEKSKDLYRVSYGAPKEVRLTGLSFMLANPRLSISHFHVLPVHKRRSFYPTLPLEILSTHRCIDRL